MDSNDNLSQPNSATREGVGYGNPPKATRFREGVSGNPRGRPRGSLNLSTVLAKALRQRVVVNERGQRKSLTKLEVTVTQLVNQATGGNLRAISQVAQLVRELEASQAATGAETPAINELDRQVLASILRRAQEATRATPIETEAEDEHDS